MSENYRNNVNDDNNIKNINKCIELINKNSGEFINSGVQGMIYKVYSSECGGVVTKKRIIIKNDKYGQNEKWIRNNFLGEYKIMKLTERMIDNFTCPNYVKVYGYISKIPLIIMEYADGDIRDFFSTKYYETYIYKTMLMQILIGLHCFHKCTLLYHCDFNPKNILYKKINKNIIFHYKIGNNNYYVPTHGYLFMITDFGSSKFALPLDREDDLPNFIYTMKYTLFTNIYNKYKHIIKNKEVDMEYTNIIKNNKLNKYLEINNIVNKHIKLIKNIKTLETNKFVFDIENILNYSNDIIENINHNFKEYKEIIENNNVVNFECNY